MRRVSARRRPLAVMARAAAAFAAAIAAAIGVYLAAAIVLGVIPVNRDWVVPDCCVEVFLRTNGIHAEIAMPIRTDAIDWASELYQPFVTYDGLPPTHISFGWGDAAFYVETRGLWEMRAWSAATALLGLNGSVLHVEHIPGPTAARGDRPIMLTASEYARLVATVRATLARTETGLVILATDTNFGHGDRFYAARGSYGPISTCNEWVRRALAAAGVRTAAWSPFDLALFWWARR